MAQPGFESLRPYLMSLHPLERKWFELLWLIWLMQADLQRGSSEASVNLRHWGPWRTHTLRPQGLVQDCSPIPGNSGPTIPGPTIPGPTLPPQRPSTHLDVVHHQAGSHHAQSREQKGHRDLAYDGEGSLREDPVGWLCELTAEASQLLALKAKLQIQLGDHHDQTVDHILRSKTSKPREPSILCPPRLHQDTFPKKSTNVERPRALCRWKVPQLPLSQGPEKTSKEKRPVWLRASFRASPSSCCPSALCRSSFFQRVAATLARTSFS